MDVAEESQPTKRWGGMVAQHGETPVVLQARSEAMVVRSSGKGRGWREGREHGGVARCGVVRH